MVDVLSKSITVYDNIIDIHCANVAKSAMIAFISLRSWTGHFSVQMAFVGTSIFQLVLQKQFGNGVFIHQYLMIILSEVQC